MDDTPIFTRAEAMAAFLEAPFFPEDTQLVVDHITCLLALLLPESTRAVDIHLLCTGYSPENAAYIWSAWEEHIRLPPSHPMAEGTRAKDCILAMLQTVYTAPDIAARDIQALTDLVASAIPTETLILFTTINLRENEMVTITPPPHPHYPLDY
jgi:hypothetical protein